MSYEKKKNQYKVFGYDIILPDEFLSYFYHRRIIN